jgi:hypothetical protein
VVEGGELEGIEIELTNAAVTPQLLFGRRQTEGIESADSLLASFSEPFGTRQGARGYGGEVSRNAPTLIA